MSALRRTAVRSSSAERVGDGQDDVTDLHVDRKAGLAQAPGHELGNRGIVFDNQGAHGSPCLLPVAAADRT